MILAHPRLDHQAYEDAYVGRLKRGIAAGLFPGLSRALPEWLSVQRPALHLEFYKVGIAVSISALP